MSAGLTQVAVVPNIAEAPSPEADQLGLPSTRVDDSRNWAEKDDIRSYVQQQVYPLLNPTRLEMMALHEEWKAIQRMLLLVHDEGKRYNGRSEAYIPVWARSLNTLVSAVSRGLFPSDEYMDVSAKDRDPTGESDERGKAVKSYLQWEFETNAHLRTELKPFLRQRFNFGAAVAKFWYDKKIEGKKVGKLSLDALGQLLNSFSTDLSEMESSGLRFSTRSIFDWYIYPLHVNSLKEATVVFEDVDVPRQYIEERIRLKDWYKAELAYSSPIVPEHQQTKQTILNDTINSNVTGSQGIGGDLSLGQIITITEVWCSIPLPAAAYLDGEEPGTPLPCKITMAGDNVLEVRRNPFWHQRPPYLVSRDNVMPGSFWPKGTGHLTRSLQYLVNDFTNQLNDNGTYALNPMAIVNPATLAAPLSPFKPGGIWQSTDPQNGVKFFHPPADQLNYGFQLVALYTSLAQDMGAGAPSILQGLKGDKTATTSQILQRNAANPIQDIVEDVEVEVLNPLMQMAHSLGQQYADAQIMAVVAGLPIKIPKTEMVGSFVFRWLASSQTANAQQRAQGALQFLQALMPLMPVLMQLGYKVDPVPLLKRLYSDALGFRGFDQIFQKMMPGGMPPGMLPPGMSQPGMQGSGPNMQNMDLSQLQSFVNQAGNGYTEPVPGEFEDGQVIRQMTDDTNGRMNGR